MLAVLRYYYIVAYLLFFLSRGFRLCWLVVVTRRTCEQGNEFGVCADGLHITSMVNTPCALLSSPTLALRPMVLLGLQVRVGV